VELGTWEKVKGDLETALHVIDDERAILAHLRVSLQERRLALQREQERARVLQEALRALPEVAERLTAAQRAVEEAQRRARLVHEMVGAARQKLDHCHMLANRRAEKVQEAEALQRESTIYSELAVAFGKKGIQAMIIEEVTPQIQDEANAILGRMTDQRMHVRFESQRSTQKGNTIETLDIKISDELGTRSYEMFSGGEAFRANFAIRIALSKLLAHRAGARLQTLIIDEGFGTQDSQGRERLIDAITSIQEDFEKILVITHFDELKDAFPARIEVTKGPNGSFAEVIE
jgi:exonuclease SbcC